MAASDLGTARNRSAWGHRPVIQIAMIRPCRSRPCASASSISAFHAKAESRDMPVSTFPYVDDIAQLGIAFLASQGIPDASKATVTAPGNGHA